MPVFLRADDRVDLSRPVAEFALMPRLIDYVRAFPFSRGINDIRLEKEAKRVLRTAMKDLTVIVGDNVAEHVYHGTDQEYWDADDFPNLAPPFGKYWIEFKRVTSINSEIYGEIRDSFLPEIEYFGALVESEEVEGQDWKWTTNHTFFAGGKNGIVGPSAIFVLLIDESGRAISRGRWLLQTNSQETMGHLTRFWGSISIPINLAVSFMHCKNVVLENRAPHERRSRQWLKKKGRKLVRYHVLEIDRMKTVLATEGQEGEVGLKRALHICRGHFKDYREGAGLFGKYPVLVWTPDHLRGSADQGVVLKDYKVV